MSKTITLDELKAQVGGDVRHSRWFTVDQKRIDAFADVTEDWQFIHTDPEKAKHTLFGGTIAHGFLSLSLLSAMAYDCEPVLENIEMAINYGFDKVRFTAPVKEGSRVRATFKTIQVDEKSATHIRVVKEVAVEIEGGGRPALTAEWIGLTMLKKGESA